MRYCLVPPTFELSNFDCGRDRRRHWHVSKKDRDELLESRAVEWLIHPRVLRLIRTFALHGASARFGTYLADALRRGEQWAIAFRGDMGGG